MGNIKKDISNEDNKKASNNSSTWKAKTGEF